MTHFKWKTPQEEYYDKDDDDVDEEGLSYRQNKQNSFEKIIKFQS
jgi:hypothetical protein